MEVKALVAYATALGATAGIAELQKGLSYQR
jgi:hypothetical protein